MVEDCAHPAEKRMWIATVPFCLACKEYLTTGICPKCGRAADDHGERADDGRMGPAFVGAALQRCPPPDPAESA